MLLIDSVKYEEWIPPSEDDFEHMVKEHTQEIFGEQSIYIDRKQKLKSLSGVGSIPDGYVIGFGNSPHWHIVEMELSSHPLHEHIVAQVSKFITGISNPNIQRTIVNALDREIAEDDFLRLKLRKAIEPTETYRFLSDLITKPPVLSIIIEKNTEGVREALSTLNHSQIKVVEFQTFERLGAESVHAHLFEPLYRFPTEIVPSVGYVNEPNQKMVVAGRKAAETRRRNLEMLTTAGGSAKRITIQNLIDAQILRVGQALWGQRGDRRYEGKIIDGGKILLSGNPIPFDTPSGAAKAIVGHAMDGWIWWNTTRANGTECLLDELRKEYERNPSP